ncbi:hypothetical protein GIB67_013826 [Kingdonia uniflora]|uniref:LOB domain-containing protein n=1 Tax=Kingdonia uniflora TaxID=39325 RepID=A0A7J7N3H2_9MAGN|nr:hypothetical protein GIB67_013826 [Kingdonia uniflora]
MSNPKRCAACKSLRRRCSKDCVLAPYFPSNDPQRFAYVHRIFGASNISRMLMQIPVDQRAEAADSMSFEAKSRVKDPVYGCVAVIGQLHQQISAVQRELAKTQGQLAIYTAQQQQQMVSTQGHYENCAACKSLRRACKDDCVLAPYFPSNDPQRFAYVKKIYGASNTSNMLKLSIVCLLSANPILQELPIEQQAEAADCIYFEAKSRVKDPVYGCVAVITQLHQHINVVQHELAKTQGELAIYRFYTEQQQMVRSRGHYGEPSWLGDVNAVQQGAFHFNQQSLIDLLQLQDGI